MAEHEPDYGKLTDHEYDGIREYDNPCPTWWHLIFLGTFIFSVVYFFFFTGSFGWTVAEAYDNAVAENLKLRFAEIGELEVNEKTLLEYMGKDDWLAVGATVFQTQCKSCHGADGSGLVGPNLTDDNYKNVHKLIDIARVIENGASAGAMPAWKNRLHPNEIVLVAAYVASLRGKNLAGPGDAVERRDGKYKPIPPWPTAAEVESEEKPEAESGVTAEPAETKPSTEAKPDAPASPKTKSSEPETSTKTVPEVEETKPTAESPTVEKPAAEAALPEKPEQTPEIHPNPLRPE